MKPKVSLLIASALCLGAQLSGAQSATIKISAYNGKTGAPLTRQRLLVFAGATQHSTALHEKNVDIETDGKGDATLVIDSSNVQWIQVFADYLILCQSSPNDRSFNVGQIISSGLSSPNTCSTRKGTNEAGRLIVFARPATFAERMRR